MFGRVGVRFRLVLVSIPESRCSTPGALPGDLHQRFPAFALLDGERLLRVVICVSSIASLSREMARETLTGSQRFCESRSQWAESDKLL